MDSEGDVERYRRKSDDEQNNGRPTKDFPAGWNAAMPINDRGVYHPPPGQDKDENRPDVPAEEPMTEREKGHHFGKAGPAYCLHRVADLH